MHSTRLDTLNNKTHNRRKKLTHNASQVVFMCVYLKRLDFNGIIFLILLFHRFDEFRNDLVGDVVGVTTALGGRDAVDKRHLLEAVAAHGKCDLPAIVHHLVHQLQLVVVVVGHAFRVQLTVLLEVLHLKVAMNNVLKT